MQGAGFRILQVFSRSTDSAKTLADQLKCPYTTNIKAINTEAGIFIFALPDDVLPVILDEMPSNSRLWIHTSGSVPMAVFRGYTPFYGVLYPLQTFSKKREIDFSEVPLLIESNHIDIHYRLNRIACCLSDRVTDMSSEKRQYLHLAAVFACNFTNHMYTLASQILKNQGIDWRLLLPLIAETVYKLYDMPPVLAQTGPAVRGDQTIIKQHLSLLENEQVRQLYALISETIQTQSPFEGGRGM